MYLINIIAISISFFFVFAIFQKKNKTKSDYHLSALVTIIAVFMGIDVWTKYNLNQLNYFLINLIEFYIFPVFISYALLIINKDEIWKKNRIWLSSYLFLTTAFFTFDILYYDYTREELDYLFLFPKLSYHIFYKSHKIFITICVIWYLKKYKSYIIELKQKYTYIEKLKLEWLVAFCYIYIAIVNLSNLAFLLYNFEIIPDIEIPFAILNGSLLISVFYLSYKGTYSYSIEKNEFRIKEIPDNKNESKKYSSSSLSEKEMEVIHKKIIDLVENDKLYLNNDLQVKDISDKTGISSHKISQTINTISAKNLYEFINEYRVEHFKSLLLDSNYSHYTILGLGLESGFNSKSSMNRIFKNFTGQTPIQFKESHTIKMVS
jgi:AraC-like DNA-binding protein